VFYSAKGPDRLCSPFELLFIEHRGCCTASKGTCVSNSPPITIQWRGQSYMELKKVGSVLSSEGGSARQAGLYVMQNMCTKCALEWRLQIEKNSFVLRVKINFDMFSGFFFFSVHFIFYTLKAMLTGNVTNTPWPYDTQECWQHDQLQTRRKTLMSSYAIGFHQLPFLFVQTNDISK